MALHLPRPRTTPLPRDLRAPLIEGERDLYFEDAVEAGWEEPVDRFLDVCIAYRWFLECGAIKPMGERPDNTDTLSTVMPGAWPVLGALEAVRTGPPSPDRDMVRHAFRVALRTRDRTDLAAAAAVIGRLAGEEL